ncbi:hypothetical protein GCM10009733_004120 [Nonomuraea maheshkhaliensis]|uniref:Uncharacterized protein n=1 Tax=Nonomuraea maheshkhaliensis TaxID=419590 RepID=A0ABN2ELL2_9ACTN
MFEDELTKTLNAAAKCGPPEDLLAGIDALRRRRRRRRAGAALAACAVAVVVGVVTALVRPTWPVSLPATTPSTMATDLTDRVARATLRIPARSPEGHKYEGVEAIDTHRLLLLSERGFDLYDASTGRITPVVRLPGRADVRTVRANERHVVWAVNVKSSERKTQPSSSIDSAQDRASSSLRKLGTPEYWTVPLSGGTPRKLPPTLGGPFDLIGDDLITLDGSGARRTALSGGQPQPIPGADNALALDLPWVLLATEPAVLGQEPAESLNVLTGEKRRLTADLCASSACLHAPLHLCSSDWCIREDRAGKPFARRTDGSRTVPLPGASTEPPALNRFAVLDGGRRLFDLTTGASAVFDPPGSHEVPPSGTGTGGGRRLLARSAGDVIWVVNLKALS